MTKKLTIILLFTSQFSLAQNKPQPTLFDKFVKNSKIEWAAYASDTFNFSTAGLNLLLLKRFGKKEIKASLPVESRTINADQIKYTVLDSIHNAFYGNDTDPLMDSLGNVVIKKIPIPQKDSSNFKLTELTQILYVEKGLLKSYIPFVTPTLPVFTSSGMYIGESFYFTSCYNFKYNSKASKESKLIFLKQTKKMIRLDPTENTDQLKSMYGKNLLETIWPYIEQNKIEAFVIDSNTKLTPGELNNYLSADQWQPIPIYDSVGNITKFSLVRSSGSGTVKFTEAALLQDWYYDAKKNKVFSYITELLLYVNKPDQKENKEPVAVLRLVFK